MPVLNAALFGLAVVCVLLATKTEHEGVWLLAVVGAGVLAGTALAA